MGLQIKMSLLEQQQQQNPLSNLYCEEQERFDDEEDEDLAVTHHEDSSLDRDCVPTVENKHPDPPLEHDLSWEEDELVSLLSKEEQIRVFYRDLSMDDDLIAVRSEAVGWILRVIGHYSFSVLTAVLAVNYLDRFIASLQFHKDKPWMSQLTAVACLSLAAKVEETQVPLLSDLQVEECRFLFEAKTIQRMELLVLSTLQWKMHPVTPLSFFDHIMRRLGFRSRLHWEFLRKCERLLLSVLADARFARHLPSVIATATMLHVIEEFEPCKSVEYRTQLMAVLKISEDKIIDCYELLDISSSYGQSLCHPPKRKTPSVPRSPDGIVDAYFSSDNSNDSWNVASSESLSHQPLFKKHRALDNQMRLTSFNRASVKVLGRMP